MSEYIAAALSPPRSLPANSHDFSSKSDSAQRSLGSIIREANPAIAEEPGEGSPAHQHVVHGLGDRVVPGQLAAALAHPGLEFGDQRRGVLPAKDEPGLGR